MLWDHCIVKDGVFKLAPTKQLWLSRAFLYVLLVSANSHICSVSDNDEVSHHKLKP